MIHDPVADAFRPGSSTIGVVGLGDMGGGIAWSIARAGFRTIVHDLRRAALDLAEERGCTIATSSAELAEACDVVSIVVVDDAQVVAVTEELLEAEHPPAVVIVQSTVIPETCRRLGELCAPRGTAVLDAGVSGGRERSERGLLTVLVGGAAEPVARCEHVFAAIGQDVFHVGPLGSGEVAKLVNNMLTLGGYALQLEAMQLAAVHGIDEESVTRFVSVSGGMSRGTNTWGRFDRFRRTHTLAGSPELYALNTKDLRSAVTAGNAVGLDLPLVGLASQLLAGKLRDRDAEVADRTDLWEIPPCSFCGQELAEPFRHAGIHPECVPMAASARPRVVAPVNADGDVPSASAKVAIFWRAEVPPEHLDEVIRLLRDMNERNRDDEPGTEVRSIHLEGTSTLRIFALFSSWAAVQEHRARNERDPGLRRLHELIPDWQPSAVVQPLLAIGLEL